MLFDPSNQIVKLCAQGMELEGNAPGEAKQLFIQAWEESQSDFERCIAAHYIARHQSSVMDKLKWDEVALNLALTIENSSAIEFLPSLYLNVAKCHEDLNAFVQAEKFYQQALSASTDLPDDGYGLMIKRAIADGIRRVKCN